MTLPATCHHTPPHWVGTLCVWADDPALAQQAARRLMSRDYQRARTHGYVRCGGKLLPWCRGEHVRDSTIYG